MVGNCVLIFFNGFLPALYFHLQCYRLRCSSFARQKFLRACVDGHHEYRSAILTEMVAILIFRKIDLPLHL